MANEWYYTKGDQQIGPVSASDLKEAAASGDLTPTSQVWKEGMAEWKPATKIKGLLDGAPGPTKTVPGSPPPASEPSAIADKAPKPSAMSSLLSTAKSAAQLAAKQAERTKLTTITLPAQYQPLGKHCYESQQHRAEFADLFQKLDAVSSQLAALATPTEGKPTPQTLGDKAKAAAGKAMQVAQSQKLSMQQSSLFVALGKAAYEAHGENSGPSSLTGPIAKSLARLSELNIDISRLSSEGKGSWITPKRLAIAGAIVACFFFGIVFVNAVRNEVRKSKLTASDASSPTDDSAQKSGEASSEAHPSTTTTSRFANVFGHPVPVVGDADVSQTASFRNATLTKAFFPMDVAKERKAVHRLYFLQGDDSEPVPPVDKQGTLVFTPFRPARPDLSFDRNNDMSLRLRFDTTDNLHRNKEDWLNHDFVDHTNFCLTGRGVESLIYGLAGVWGTVFPFGSKVGDTWIADGTPTVAIAWVYRFLRVEHISGTPCAVVEAVYITRSGGPLNYCRWYLMENVGIVRWDYFGRGWDWTNKRHKDEWVPKAQIFTGEWNGDRTRLAPLIWNKGNRNTEAKTESSPSAAQPPATNQGTKPEASGATTNNAKKKPAYQIGYDFGVEQATIHAASFKTEKDKATRDTYIAHFQKLFESYKDEYERLLRNKAFGVSEDLIAEKRGRMDGFRKGMRDAGVLLD